MKYSILQLVTAIVLLASILSMESAENVKKDTIMTSCLNNVLEKTHVVSTSIFWTENVFVYLDSL